MRILSVFCFLLALTISCENSSVRSSFNIPTSEEESLGYPTPLGTSDPAGNLEQLASEGSLCVPGEKICHNNGVSTCNANGTALFDFKPCYSDKVCQDGACIERLPCTMNSCDDPFHCPLMYPPCPYGTQFGEIAEDTAFMDPTVDGYMYLSDLYDPKSPGLIALIAANGW